MRYETLPYVKVSMLLLLVTPCASIGRHQLFGRKIVFLPSGPEAVYFLFLIMSIGYWNVTMLKMEHIISDVLIYLRILSTAVSFQCENHTRHVSICLGSTRLPFFVTSCLHWRQTSPLSLHAGFLMWKASSEDWIVLLQEAGKKRFKIAFDRIVGNPRLSETQVMRFIGGLILRPYHPCCFVRSL
jgi:hypothetical protein